jgi:Zn-dependent M28 family amino/carboxypeptidase
VTQVIRRIVDSHPHWVVVALFAYLTVLGVGVVLLGVRTYQVAHETHQAACALKVDYGHRISQTEAFLARHPNGVAGISRADFLMSISNQERTLHSFRFLSCGDS